MSAVAKSRTTTDVSPATKPPSDERDATFWSEVEEAFSAVLSAGDSARTAALSEHCRARPAVRAEVEALLAAHVRAGEFIVPLTAGDGEARDGPAENAETHVPNQVGPFRLHECVGEGGMGAVYRAERVQGDFDQRVAVKLISSRLYGADTLRRFRAERQILASLQHPNIVALLDGGVTTTGHPYIAMEYVEGLPITVYCAQQRLALRERLRLFRQLCSAVSFAHRHLVVHRDLKPANVLVTSDGTVKVLDFGVAKLLDSSGANAEATGALLGPLTPDFASPEQIKGAPITTASDVYALGVMLYELISGRRPYQTAGKTLDQLLALVLHHEPARPSTMPASDLPYDLRVSRGDLDAVVLKAMAKNPEQRYASAEELAAEIERYLEGLPISARPRSMRYLAGKLVARHKAAFAVATVFLTLLLGALGIALWQARVAAHERERAVRRFNDVRQLAGAMIFKLHDEIAPLEGSTSARRTVIAEGLKFLEILQQDAAGDPALQLELALAYVRIGDVLGDGADANLGDSEGARRAYLQARDLLRTAATSPDVSPEVTLAWTEVHLHLARMRIGTASDRREAALVALQTASSWYTRFPADERARELLARAHFQLAALAIKHPDSLPHWLEAERIFEARLAAAPQDGKRQRQVALVHKYLGWYYGDARDIDLERTHHRRAYELDRLRLRSTPGDRLVELDLAVDLNALADMDFNSGDYARAIATYLESLEIRRRLSESDPKDARTREKVGYMHRQLADAYRLAGRLHRARAHAERAVQIYQGLSEPALHALAFVALAEIETAEHRTTSACDAYVQAQRLFAEGVAAGFPSREPEIVAKTSHALMGCKG